MKKIILGIFACCLTALFGADLAVSPTGRQVFYRNEPDAFLEVEISHTGNETLKRLTLELQLTGLPSSQVKLRTLNGQAKATCSVPVETRLKPGSYPGKLLLRNKNQVLASGELTLRIGPTLRDLMPVVIWGFGQGYKTYQDIGFTHGIQSTSIVYTRDWDHKEVMKRHIARCDNMLADGFFNVDYFFGAHVPKYQKAFPRYGRNGKPRTDASNVEASNPALQKIFADIAEKTAIDLKNHPGLDGVLINSEVRDSSNPSFHQFEPEAFRKFAGYDIPAEVEDKTGPHYTRIKDFPYSRVIPENNPLLVYYRWFWKEGDGWNPVQSLIHDSYKKHIKRPFWTFFDPAVRVPPVWGSGGRVDYLSHWTYAYPDPINIGANTSEIQAMAKGRPGQGVMNMTQVICYRSATAPIGQKVSNPPAWLKDFPTSRYITLAPDLMRIAVWTQLSRHTSGIMFHGWNSLIPEIPRRPTAGYVCTNLKTRDALSEILHNVVKPLGPVLKRIPERPMEVAILESFASSVFAGRGTWGWTSWAFDAHLMLLWANLAPGVVYEETLLRDGFGDIKVLIMPHCDVLTEPVFKAIQDFQKRGGLIVADETVVPGITPDILLTSFRRQRKPETDKLELQKMGTEFRSRLAPFYTPYAASSNPDLVTWIRSAGNADYLFVTNDKRTFGTYYGQYGQVMEKGLPNKGQVTLQRSAGAVYSLTAHREVPYQTAANQTTIPVEFSGAGGDLFLVLPEAIGEVRADSPRNARRGRDFDLKISVHGKSGKVLPALFPLEITVRDPQGRNTDDTRFAAAEEGRLKLNFTPSLNEPAGTYQIIIRDLASGKTYNHAVNVK